MSSSSPSSAAALSNATACAVKNSLSAQCICSVLRKNACVPDEDEEEEGGGEGGEEDEEEEPSTRLPASALCPTLHSATTSSACRR